MSEIHKDYASGKPYLNQVFKEDGEFIQAVRGAGSTRYLWSSSLSLLDTLQVARNSGLVMAPNVQNHFKGPAKLKDTYLPGESVVDYVASTAEQYINQAHITYLQGIVLWSSARVVPVDLPAQLNRLSIERSTPALDVPCFAMIEGTAGPRVTDDLYRFASAAVKHLAP